MQEQKVERGPRGRYARLICRGCRSRKIKCSLPNPDEIVHLGIPQTVEKSCQRCRHFGLECIVERTTLGRPAPRRHNNHSKRSHDPSPSSLAESNSRHDDESDSNPSPCNLEIQDYLYADVPDDDCSIPQRVDQPGDSFQRQRPSRREIFLSMIDYHYFFSSVLANDRTFGASIPRATSRWRESLPKIISNGMAASLDKCLVWHRFFLPQTPSLVSLRNHLCSDESAATNTATNLLFALLCLTACEISGDSFVARKQQPLLEQNLRLAVAFYGQEFVLSPPTHRDSIVLCLFLSDYKPTALTTLQSVAHKAIRSELYVSLAWRIADRMEILPGQDGLSSHHVSQAPNDVDFERCLIESIQGLQIVSHDVNVGGHLSTPLRQQRQALERMKPFVDAYKCALGSRPCSPMAIFHIQSTVGAYILLENLVDAKQNRNDPERLIMIAEEVERECLEQIKISHCALVDASKYGQRVELSAVRSLLELHFNKVFVTICGLGIVYTSAFSSRLQSGRTEKVPEMLPSDALQIGTQVARSMNQRSDGAEAHFSRFLSRYGKIYPAQQAALLDVFVECMRLELGGIALRPTFQQTVLEIVVCCRNIVENNTIHLRCFGILGPHFTKQLDLFRKCVQQLDVIVASSGGNTTTAFASGCVYAASSKIIAGLAHILENLQTEASKAEAAKVTCSGQYSATADYSDEGWGSGLAFPPPSSSSSSSSSWEASNLQPFVGVFDPVDASQYFFDWSLATDLDINAGFGLDLTGVFQQNLDI